MPITQNCTVVDFYQSNMHEYDANFAFMPLGKLQQIRGMIDPSTGIRSVSAIQMKLRPGANLDQARDKLNSFFPPNQYTSFIIQTWRDAQRPLLSAVMMELTILNILLFLIIAVAGFGILATFYMIVVEKMKDIGILKALGASRRGVMSIFLSYGCSLGLAGASVGIGLGLLFVAYINEIADWIQFATGREVFDPTMYYFSQIPTAVSPWCVAWVAFGAVAIALMASVLPAIRAARLNPVETLRYE
jgi:lipoprotein-releasing system permease protein